MPALSNVKWASISRTLDSLERSISDSPHDESSIALEELNDLRQSLVQIHDAVRRRHTLLDKVVPQPEPTRE